MQVDAAPPPAPREGQEIVHRPDPGLARGRFEAPPWAFVVAAALVTAALAAFVVRAVRSRR